MLGTGKVVLFAVPGAFTPGCSKLHLPGYVQHGDELKAKGVDTIACVSVNDAWVMDAWAEAQGVGDSIVMLADGNGEFTAAMGLELDAVASVSAPARSLRRGHREWRHHRSRGRAGSRRGRSSCENLLTKV